MKAEAWRNWVIAAALSTGLLPSLAPAQGDEELGRTPPRISYIDGEVSFWRPGAEDWTEARVNTPLAPGDQLYTGDRSILELQIGARAYVRADNETQIGIENHERDFLQVKVTSGRVSFDIRGLNPVQSIEVATPNAAFVIEETGYYRADVDAEATAFLVRRGGRASLTPINGTPVSLGAGAAAAVRGTDFASVETYAAPQSDAWDGWNDGRSDQFVASASSQYLPEDAYGAEELDRHGDWRTVPSYGPVWVPRVVAPGWAPYTAGRWLWDGYYGWTWLSYDPWGWAPFHYGRWVHFDNYWGWAPGPRVVSAVYYPALVGFFGGGVSVGVGVGPIGWVALGWGEPIYPWWGRRGYIGEPCWNGWGGPRNNVYINKTKIIYKNKIEIDGYRNSRHRDAVVVVPRDRFGRDGIEKARLRGFDRRALRPVDGRLAVKPTADSLGPRRATASRPPRDVVNRSVVGTRRPHDVSSRLAAEGLRAPRAVPESRVRLVDGPRQQRQARLQQVPPPRDRAPRGSDRAEQAPPRSRRQDAAPANRYQAPPQRSRPQQAAPASRMQAPPPRSRPQQTYSAPRAPAGRAAASQPRVAAPRPQRSRPQQSVTRRSAPRERPVRTERAAPSRGLSRSFAGQPRIDRGGGGSDRGGRTRSKSD